MNLLSPSGRRAALRLLLVLGLLAVVCGEITWAQNPQQAQRSRRSQRVVPMDEVHLASPDGRVKLVLLGNPERLTFQVTLDGRTVIEPSPISMRVDGFDLSSGVVLRGELERDEVNETYPWFGAHSMATNRSHGVRIPLRHDLSSVDFTFEARAFNDGVAFRHVILGASDVSRVPDEYSTFVLPSGSTVWYAELTGGHYEAEYQKREVSDVPPGEWGGPPVTFKLPDGRYGAITEANLVDYAGMGLEADGRRGWTIGLGHRHPLNYPFELRYGRDEGKRLGQPAAVNGTITTPWRVVMTGRDLHTLANSTILPNLCPPPDPALFPEGLRTEWIKPGRAVWRYLDGGPRDLEGMKEFARLANKLGFEHHVIEGFWSRWSMDERKELADYSRGLGVDLWFWKHSNQLRTPEAQKEFFQMLEQLGVAGAKIDFFDHEAKELIDLYEALLRTAAEHKVMLVFHGANKPTGRERTWPNDVVREAVRGMESSGLRERARHEAILPFTRYLAGGADYTVLMFGERRRDSTWAHQIATLAVFASPLLTIAANPQTMVEHPATEMIRSVPAIWDETLVLKESEIGELAAYARRSGDTWFLAVLCGKEARSLRVPLSFLGGRSYETLMVRDQEGNPAAVEIEKGRAQRSDVLTIQMEPGGGFIGRFH